MSERQRTLIAGGTVVTMNAQREVHTRADLLLEGSAIVKIARRIRPRGFARVIDAKGCAVLPGLIQGHVHLCQALFRGMANDLPLMKWLRTRIWPLEGAHDAASMRASARLGLAEMIKGGTTTILDFGSVHHQDVVFRAMRESGIRGISGKSMMDAGRGVPTTMRETTEASLKESLALAEQWHGVDGRLGYAFAPRFILSCSEKLFRRVADEARARGLMIHTHASEHPGERTEVRAALGMDDIDALRKWRVCGPHVVLAHGVQLTARHRKLLGRDGTRVVHCPSANMKLASGIADVVAMHDASIVVGIGHDGAPCNNRMDAWTEMRSAALLAKAKRLDAAALPAERALTMATIDGARALGLDAITGSLEAGKRADVIVVDLEPLHALVGGDPMSQLVYSSVASDVRHVFIDGTQLVRDGAFTRANESAIRRAAKREAKRVRARAL